MLHGWKNRITENNRTLAPPPHDVLVTFTRDKVVASLVSVLAGAPADVVAVRIVWRDRAATAGGCVASAASCK